MQLEYDEYGRMKYNPEIHFNHGAKFTSEELAYLCKFYNVDGPIALSYALGRTQATIIRKYNQLDKNGLVEKYIEIWEKQFKE